MAAWTMVSKPKTKGGLWVLNLRLQNDDALLLKQLHKFYNKMDVPWVHLVWFRYYDNGRVPHGHREVGSFWWKDLIRLSVIYKELLNVKLVMALLSSLGKIYGVQEF